jgi:hypothetical protein
MDLGAFAFFALCVDFASHLFKDVLTYAHTEPCTFRVDIRMLLEHTEVREKLIEILFFDAHSVVFYHDVQFHILFNFIIFSIINARMLVEASERIFSYIFFPIAFLFFYRHYNGVLLRKIAFLFFVNAEDDFDHASFTRELETIGHKVGDDLIEAASVAEHLREDETLAHIILYEKLDALVLSLELHHLEGLTYHLKDVEEIVGKLES